MSDKPKIYANCKAGCLWETVHKSDFDMSASIIKLADGSRTFEPMKTYKIIPKDTSGWGCAITLAVDYYADKGGGYVDYTEIAEITLPLHDKYSESFTFRLCGWEATTETDSEGIIVGYGVNFIYELNGERITHEMSVFSDSTGVAPFEITDCSAIFSGTASLYLFNADATIKGESGDEGKSAYEYAVEGGYTGTESEFAYALGCLKKNTIFAILTEEEMDAVLSSATEDNVGEFYMFVGTTTDKYKNGVVYRVSEV